MAKLPKKSNLEQFSKEEIIVQLLRVMRKCDKLERAREQDSNMIAVLERSIISLEKLRHIYWRKLGSADAVNARLLDLTENALKELGVGFHLHSLRTVDDQETLCRLHRSDN